MPEADQPIRGWRDLRVWQEGLDLVDLVYTHVRRFPVSEEYALGSQMRRAAVSVPANIAEGHAREGTREYLHHLSIAQGSLAELETHVEIAARLGYVSDEQRSALMIAITRLGRQTRALRQSLKRKTP